MKRVEVAYCLWREGHLWAFLSCYCPILDLRVIPLKIPYSYISFILWIFSTFHRNSKFSRQRDMLHLPGKNNFKTSTRIFLEKWLEVLPTHSISQKEESEKMLMLKTIVSKLSFFICLLLLPNNLCITVSTREQCQKDCQATGCPLTYTNATRLSGPTRPFHRYDTLGAPLSLTRPYPFAITAEEATVITLHISLTVIMSDQYGGVLDKIKLTDPEEAPLAVQ
jgi:hypothetical protein